MSGLFNYDFVSYCEANHSELKAFANSSSVSIKAKTKGDNSFISFTHKCTSEIRGGFLDTFHDKDGKITYFDFMRF